MKQFYNDFILCESYEGNVQNVFTVRPFNFLVYLRPDYRLYPGRQGRLHFGLPGPGHRREAVRHEKYRRVGVISSVAGGPLYAGPLISPYSFQVGGPPRVSLDCNPDGAAAVSERYSLCRFDAIYDCTCITNTITVLKQPKWADDCPLTVNDA